MKTDTIILALVGLLLVACSHPATPQHGLEASDSTTLPRPTDLPRRASQAASNIRLPNSFDLPEQGVNMSLPLEWNILRQPGVVLAGPGLTSDNSMVLQRYS